MPAGPIGQKRPADVIGNAVHVMKVLTGEADDASPDDGKDKAAQAMGRKGGTARAKAMTPPAFLGFIARPTHQASVHFCRSTLFVFVDPPTTDESTVLGVMAV